MAISATLTDIWRLSRSVSSTWRQRAAWVICLMVLGASAEVLTLGAIVPFLAALSGEAANSLMTGPNSIVGILPGMGSADAMLSVSVLFVTLAVLAGGLRIVLIWYSNRFVFGLGHDICVRLFDRELRQPYHRHISRNSADVIGAINKVQIVINDVLMHLVRGVSALLIAIAIMAALLFINPVVAGLSLAGLGSIYCLVTFAARKGLHHNSATISRAQSARIQTVQEGLGAIRDVILERMHGHFVHEFENLDRELQRAHMRNVCAAKIPRYVIEALSIVVITFIALYLAGKPGGLSTALPVLGALALGGQRLLPLVQDVYQGWAQLNGYGQVVRDIVRLVGEDEPQSCSAQGKTQPGRFACDRIALSNVSFRYDTGSQWVFCDINMMIKKGERVALIGPTGGGKSTFVDLIMGFLVPGNGELRIDGHAIDAKSLQQWQNHIAHVPQSSFLLDASIAENIALGVQRDDIDMARVQQAAQGAQISEFVEALPDGYRTRVGERGIRFSGGQRQRIAIARALYKKAAVLVLDEATSALDSKTEAKIMNSIANMNDKLTVLMITHREASLGWCDRVVKIEDGQISEFAAPDETRDQRIQRREAFNARNILQGAAQW